MFYNSNRVTLGTTFPKRFLALSLPIFLMFGSIDLDKTKFEFSSALAAKGGNSGGDKSGGNSGGGKSGGNSGGNSGGGNSGGGKSGGNSGGGNSGGGNSGGDKSGGNSGGGKSGGDKSGGNSGGGKSGGGKSGGGTDGGNNAGNASARAKEVANARSAVGKAASAEAKELAEKELAILEYKAALQGLRITNTGEVVNWNVEVPEQPPEGFEDTSAETAEDTTTTAQ